MPRLPVSRVSLSLQSQRFLSTTPSLTATPLPLTSPGPPPAPPKPSVHQYGERVERRRRQAELLKRGQDLRSAPSAAKPGAALKKRFWKDVHVRTDAEGHHIVTLDSRAVRAPASKTPLTIPKSKPALAAAIALEWDLLISAAQALRNHLIPLTSLASRASDIAAQDDGVGLVEGKTTAREEIITVMLRYFDTDTLLCWAPVKSGFAEASGLEGDASSVTSGLGGDKTERVGSGSLRDLQIATANPIIHYLTTYVWPGVSIHPAFGEEASVLPRRQEKATKDVIRGWMMGLGPWELAGLERATLAGKSLLVGARLVTEWSERSHGMVNISGDGDATPRFGIEEAAKACSLEVSWQTVMWGEVEDTHDVEKEDLKRQLGSVILLVSGTGHETQSS